MKKIKFKIIWVLVWMFLLSWIVYATYYVNKWTDSSTFYRVNNWVTKNIDRGVECRKVVNSSWNHLFIPIKTNTEWYSFVNNKPSGVSIPDECYVPYWNKWSSYWMRGPWSAFTVCYHWECVIGNTSGESAHIYRYWLTTRRGYTYAYPGWKVKRWSFHHSSGGSNYYYVTIK